MPGILCMHAVSDGLLSVYACIKNMYWYAGADDHASRTFSLLYIYGISKYVLL